MERYEIIKEVGEGSNGSVFRAKNRQTGEIVAVKRIKWRVNSSWDQCLKSNEVQSLLKMNHPNIIKLKEFIRHYDVLFFVFECMDCSLLNLMEARGMRPFSESEIKNWCIQVFNGLAHMHRRGYFHRDLKPENLLLKQDIIKIADLGAARAINSQTPFTEVVGTLWYRAPELLLQTQFYDSKVDMWAMGAIMAEMFMGRALFPGFNEADQLSKICRFTGNANLGNSMYHYNFPSQFNKGGNDCMSALIPNASAEAISLMKLLCSWDPRDRPTAIEALRHPFFRQDRVGVPRRLPLRPTVAVRGPPPGFESSRGSRPMAAAARIRGPPPGFESSSSSNCYRPCFTHV